MEAVTAAAVFAAAAGVAIAYSSQQKPAGPPSRASAAGRSDSAAPSSASGASASATLMYARPTAHSAKAVLPAASAGDVLLHPIDHLDAFGAELPTFASPLVSRTWPRNQNFVVRNEYVLTTQSFVADELPAAAAGSSGTGSVSAAGSLHRMTRSHSSASMDAAGRDGSLVLLDASPAPGAAQTPVSGAGVSGGAGAPTTTAGAPEEEKGPRPLAFATAGPCRVLYHNPATTRMAIATCGGLCPGLNTVIRELVMAATYVYNVPRGNIYGVPDGYRGFYGDPAAWVPLQPESVSRIHSLGGTILGSSRGGMDPDRILDGIIAQRINIVVLIGGDGTHRGAALLAETAAKRGYGGKISFACVPKTVDNDIPVIDRSFGVQTAVEMAVKPIESAHTEAHSATNGIGLVKLMGRSAGFIALYASLASRDVNVCLIPEAPWRLSKLCSYLEERLDRSRHAVIVVAEGAESIERAEEKAAAAAAGGGGKRTDESGNPVLDDVGEYIKAGVLTHFKKRGIPVALKYIEPSYIVRSAPANAADSDLCTQLAFNAVHGAFAGYTAFSVGVVDNVGVWLPVQLLTTGKPRRVDVTSRIYARLISSTGQPNLE